MLDDYELLAQQLSTLGERVGRLENHVTDLAVRLAEVENVNRGLEAAALITSRSLAEISSHWDAVYEAMRRVERRDAASGNVSSPGEEAVT